MIVEAEGLLTAASRKGRFGRFQCEAAIQSVHVQRPITGSTNYAALVTLYRMLVANYPSIGAKVSLAAVLIESGDAAEAVRTLDEVSRIAVDTYQPYWVARSRAERAIGQDEEAERSLARAIALTASQAGRAFLSE
jgi:RNA polymerase sigma-70 factor (ECF subfamily)